MKLPFKLYEEATDGGSGGGAAAGSGPSQGGGGNTGSASGSLLAGSSSTGTVGGGSAAASSQGTSGNGPAAGASPYFVGLYDSTGKIDKTKYDALPADLKPYAETFKKYDTFESLLRGTANLAQLAGKKGLQPLPADAPEEAKKERSALMRQLNNVPEKPEGYGVKKPDDLPAERWNDDYANGMMGILHKHNASPELVKELFAADRQLGDGMFAKSEAAQAAALEAEGKALREAFGAEYAQKMDLASRGARTLGLDPNDPIFRSAKVVQAMAKVAEMISEDRLVSGDNDTTLGGNDRAKALDIVNNEANPLNRAYHNSEDPRHDEAVKQVMALNKRAHEARKARSA